MQSVQTIDNELAPQLAIRRKHREGVGPAFFDASLYTQGHVGVLPEALRPKPGRLSHSQDFFRLPWQNQSNQNVNAVPLSSPAPPGSVALQRGYSSGSAQLNPAVFSSSLGNSGINAVAHSLDPEDMEPNSVKLLSASSVHSAMAGGIGSHNFENEAVLSSFSSVSVPELQIPESSNVSKSIIVEVPGVILRCISRDEAALAVAQKVFKGLYENASNTGHVGAHLAMLAAIRDVSKLVFKALTSWVIYSDEDRKFNKDITIGLIRRELLNLAEYNVYMSRLLDAGRNKVATEFAISLVQTLVASDSRVISELQHLVDALAKLATRPDASEALRQLVEIARNPSASSSGLPSDKDDSVGQTKDKKVAAASWDDGNAFESSEAEKEFQDKVTQLFAEWYRIYELPGVNDQLSARFVLQLQKNGYLKADDTSDRFFRWLLDIAVSHCISSEGTAQSHQQAQTLSFLAIDVYASLVFSILKARYFSSLSVGSDCEVHSEGFRGEENTSTLAILDGIKATVIAFESNDHVKNFVWLELVISQKFHAETAEWKCSEGVALLSTVAGRLLLVYGAFLEEYLLAETNNPQKPRILSEVDAALKAKQMKTDVDEYLKTQPQGTSFLSGCKNKRVPKHVLPRRPEHAIHKKLHVLNHMVVSI
ncbi:CCR4-NOT transcription complex subunit 1 isoform X1 [Tanacetum coccineum]